MKKFLSFVGVLGMIGIGSGYMTSSVMIKILLLIFLSSLDMLIRIREGMFKII
ncbi:hypothetical protein KKG61_03845 [bacterium]|nr:hypothetical protein [bacterium]MBU1599220.1 hypothetical protein [bacterium]